MSSADSHGRSTLRADPIFIFDLDGTILSVNSYRYFALYLLCGKFEKTNRINRLILSLKTTLILTARKLGRSHRHTKRRLQQLWQQVATQVDINSFSAQLRQKIRPNMETVLAAKKEPCLLATAAASEYVMTLGRQMGFQHILATPAYEEGDLPENVAQEKCDRAIAYLLKQSWHDRPIIFSTDHAEDLPLVKKSALVLWFGADDEIRALQMSAPHVKIMPCLNLSGRDIQTIIDGYDGAR